MEGAGREGWVGGEERAGSPQKRWIWGRGGWAWPVLLRFEDGQSADYNPCPAQKKLGMNSFEHPLDTPFILEFSLSREFILERKEN